MSSLFSGYRKSEMHLHPSNIAAVIRTKSAGNCDRFKSLKVERLLNFFHVRIGVLLRQRLIECECGIVL